MIILNSVRAAVGTGIRTFGNDINAVGQFFDQVTSFR